MRDLKLGRLSIIAIIIVGLITVLPATVSAQTTLVGCQSKKRAKRIRFFPNSCPGKFNQIDSLSISNQSVLSVDQATFSTEALEDTPDADNLEKLAEFGTVTKNGDDTTWRLTFNGQVMFTSNGVAGGSCSFQIRVNDAAANGSTSLSFSSAVGGTFTIDDSNDAVAGPGDSIVSPASVTAYFDNLPAGDHVISLYTRGIRADDCILNPGGFTQTILVEELRT